MTKQPIHESMTTRCEEIFRHNLDVIHVQTDRLFARLLVGQWLAAILISLWISPLTWIGSTNQTHLHVWAALFLGGAIVSLPVFLGFRRSGAKSTRHFIAVSQMLTGALLIHLTGGRIETHFKRASPRS